MRRGLLAAVLLFPLGGCYTVHYNVKGRSPDGKLALQKRREMVLFGYVKDEPANIAKACGKAGPARVETTESFEDYLLATVTFGILNYRTAKVWCRK